MVVSTGYTSIGLNVNAPITAKANAIKLPICDRTTKFFVSSMPFAFAVIGTFALAFKPMEAPQYVYMLFQFLPHSHTVYLES